MCIHIESPIQTSKSVNQTKNWLTTKTSQNVNDKKKPFIVIVIPCMQEHILRHTKKPNLNRFSQPFSVSVIAPKPCFLLAQNSGG
jgi:hypothetical protein